MSTEHNAPVIVAPLSRLLGVADLERSTAFYHDVLGFAVQPRPGSNGSAAHIEATHGPARIQLTREDRAPDSTGVERPRGAAVLFLQVDDVAAWQKLIAARGGRPSEREKVNWIKMEMFQLRDPDGHTLWFGQSCQQPGQERPAPMMRTIMPQFPVADVAASVAHYVDVLGFTINYQQQDLAVLDRDKARIIVINRADHHAGTGTCYVYVRDADALYEELHGRGARVQGEPVSHPWGLRDFTVLDLDGNELVLGQTFE